MKLRDDYSRTISASLETSIGYNSGGSRIFGVGGGTRSYNQMR